MKLPIVLKITAVASLLALFGPTAYAQKQETRSVGSFDQIKASGAINVLLKQGSETTVKAEASPEVLAHLKTEVQDGVLKIYRDYDKLINWSDKGQKVTVYITCPRLRGVEVGGASDLKSESTFEAETFAIRASGASDVTMALQAKSLSVRASGASDVTLSGKTERQDVAISGSSDYRASNLQSKRASVQASGSSDAYLATDELVSSHTSGSSDIHNKSKSGVMR
ncbi:head GIN domain-containing protein [Hymenobacter jejuensis]|uniref:DUF2807 domain-containing protein n=1 Tax=Hymenobacter jejuensis TaxID=2502781 RepID=A0A5B8A019_9BACT|nr:head GIN domain-containing protein [Hymenobacter jejuensis]QDA60477.1 DUF2807 domain-containing protein [Hymenobacter jejuensis]